MTIVLTLISLRFTTFVCLYSACWLPGCWFHGTVSAAITIWVHGWWTRTLQLTTTLLGNSSAGFTLMHLESVVWKYAENILGPCIIDSIHQACLCNIASMHHACLYRKASMHQTCPCINASMQTSMHQACPCSNASMHRACTCINTSMHQACRCCIILWFWISVLPTGLWPEASFCCNRAKYSLFLK